MLLMIPINSGKTFSEEPVRSEPAGMEYVDYVPTWCQPGWECHKKGTGGWFDLQQLADIDKKLIDLEAKVNIDKTLKMRHFGWCVGGGMMIGPELNAGEAGITGTLGVGVLWGWRF